jgi:hypothetical protein
MTAPPDTGDSTQGRMHFVVIVLGDVGRSPRMQYHAASLLVSSLIINYYSGRHAMGVPVFYDYSLWPSLSCRTKDISSRL